MSEERAPYWTLEPAAALDALGTRRSGLHNGEAAERLARYGGNTVTAAQETSALRLALRQVESPLVLILVFGAAVALTLREWTDAIIILLIVVASAVLGFVQEYRASAAIAKLRERLSLKVTVRRNGEAHDIDARDVVPGDVVLLSAGNLVPADGIVLEARDFLVSEASLTGETFPVEKRPGQAPREAALAQRTNCVFLGTSVRSGTAEVMVARTGLKTEYGAIAGRMASEAPESEFAQGLRQFGYLLSRVMIAMVLFVLTANLLLGRPLVESLLFAVALAVGLSPELLPAIVSVTLSAGARRMAESGVIIRHLDAIENLGSIDILCTDKTGTLTRGVVELSAATAWDGVPSQETWRLAIINAQLETGITNPLDEAIIAAEKKSGTSIELPRKIDEIPYDFRRKRLTVVTEASGAPDEHVLITKGAFDTVVSCCARIDKAGSSQSLDEDARSALESYYRQKGTEGFRVLAVATRQLSARHTYTRDDEAGMTFRGFLLFFDPLKDGIASTIQGLQDLGISIKIITGDNRHVACHVGDAIGLDTSRVIDGAELNETRDEALWHLAETTDLFVEVDPQQKERIVRALQRRGHAVAYMGDGINDAPALHASDVGVSVDSAVDVARESAAVVLLRQDLDVLRAGIVQGRTTFANTLKYIAITTSANFGNMISMAIATLFVPFLPLAAKQILLNNFLSDFPSIAISADNVDPEATATAQRWNIREVRAFMLVFGMVSTVFDLLTFAVLLKVFEAGEALFQTTWFAVSLLTELAVVLVLRTHLSCLKSRPSLVLLAATAIVGVLTLLLPYSGGLARSFGFVPLPWTLLLAALGVLALYVIATEATKSLFYGERGGHPWTRRS